MNNVEQKYNEFWKEIVENPDGTLNKEQIMKELADFSVLIDNLSKIYDRISSGIVSKPMTNAKTVLALYEEALEEAYERGYEDGVSDHVNDN